MSDPGALRTADHRHLWHPYTDIAAFEHASHRSIQRAQGVYLYDTEGRALLDGISSWWCVALGHGHPRIVEAIRQQAGELQHSILGTLSHPRAIELAERLANWVSPKLPHVYYAADGACAVDAALKMARQYWLYRGQPRRTRFVSLEEAYHGDTLGAIGVGFTSWFQDPYGALVVPALRAPSPHLAGNVDDETQRAHALAAFRRMENIVEERETEIAGIVLEPLCQAAAGIRIYPPEYLQWVRRLCDETGILMIVDEIATGFGRTGKRFACDHAGIAPDIMCLGKALTGGYLPLSATLATDAIYDVFRSTAEKRVFWDGHTFCGNPITAAAALAALDVFDDEDIITRAQPAMRQLAEGFAQLARMDGVTYHRALGMIAMCALSPEAGGASAAAAIAARCLEEGLFIRALGEVLYLWPPLTTSPDELKAMLGILNAAMRG